jgi:uncharacterized protein (TIGR02996 family)
VETDDGFIGAILTDPSDETVQLVYADWLDERGDPRGEFLRLRVEWNREWAGGHHPPMSLSSRIEELRAAIDPGWVAVLDTLGVPSEPAKLWFECFGHIDPPLAEALVTRKVWGRQGRLAGLATFASQFRLTAPPDNGLAADLRMLAELIHMDLGVCCYGPNDFKIYPFLVELSIGGEKPNSTAILAGLKANAIGEGSGESDEDYITNDKRQQNFFRHEEGAELTGAHAVLSQHVAPSQLWYVLLHTRHMEYAKQAVHFAVAPSPFGKRMVGVLAGGYW